MTDAASFEFDDLAAHLGWVRALAGRLVQDAHAAEDLTQETLRAALEARQGEAPRPRSTRAWLAGVLRNQGRAHYRTERARGIREKRYSRTRGEAQPSTLETLERAASQRHLIDAVLGIDEPYRTVILLRFFEELSTREVAERTDCPPSTVATRTAEGLRRIRERLRGGERGDWLPALLPLLPEQPVASASLWFGPLLLTGAAKVVGAALLFLALAGVWWMGSSPGSLESLQPVGAEQDELEALGSWAADQMSLASKEERSEAAPSAGTTTSAETASTPALVVMAERRGQVVDEEGRPVPQVEVVYEHRAPLDVGGDHHAGVTSARTDRCTSDERGFFLLRGQPPMTVTVRDPRYVTVHEGRWMRGDLREPRVVIARRVPLAGRILDEQGEAVAEANLLLLFPAADPTQGASASRRWWTQSDAKGEFELGPIPALHDLHLRVGAMGFAARMVPIPRGGDAQLTVVLSEEAFEGLNVEGLVRLASGEPAAGAWVSAGTRSVRCDDEGRYRLSWQLLEPATEVRLQATSPGSVPAARVIELPWSEDGPLVVDLELGGPLPRLSGRVIDIDGQPLPGIEVELLEGTPFGLIQDPERGWYQRKTLEDMSGSSSTRTDRQGQFELTGLPGRRYVVQASRWRDAAGVVSQPVEAGISDLVLVLDVSQLDLEGRVVDLAGNPIEGVQLRPTRRRGDGGFSIATGFSVSDAQGRFRWKAAPRTLQALRLEGEAIVPEVYQELSDLPWRGEALEVVAARRCELRLDWGLDRRDSLSVTAIGPSGETQAMLAVSGSGISIIESCSPPPAGESIFCLARTAEWAVLRDGEREIARYPLKLDPDEQTLLRL